MRRAVLATLSAALFAAAPLRADDPKALPTDLALVPADAAGFAHVRLADLWLSDAMSQYRDIFLKADPRALQLLDTRFVPALSSIDRVTLIVLAPPAGGREPPIALILRTKAPFDGAKLVASALPGAKARQEGTVRVYWHERLELGVRIYDERTVIFATNPGTPALLVDAAKAKAGTPHPLTAALQLAAAGKKTMVVAANSALLPPQAIAEAPPPLQPLLKAKQVMLTMTVGKETQFDAQLRYADETAAADGERGARAGVEMARQMLSQAKKEVERRLYEPDDPATAGQIDKVPEALAMVAALGAIKQADEVLAGLPLERKGDTVAVAVTVPAGPLSALVGVNGVAIGLLLPAVQKVRQAADRMKDSNNLKQIALAMHNYESAYSYFPTASINSRDGKPLLSWRVAILPFIEQDNLYRQFHLDEPWDSEHNKKLLDQMPAIYQIPGTPPSRTHTHYRVFVGGGPGGRAMFDYKEKTQILSITDGTSNTLMVVEAAEAVPWTKPDELVYDPNKPLPKLFEMSGGCNAAFGDGSVRFIRADVAENVLRALITRDGGEVIDTNELDGPRKPAAPPAAVPTKPAVAPEPTKPPPPRR
jgi:prepilin-type processing-associated H-X9-DG protein